MAKTIKTAIIIAALVLGVMVSRAYAVDGVSPSGKDRAAATQKGPLAFPDKTAIDESVVPNDVETLEKSAKKYDLPEGTSFSVSTIWRTIGSLAVVIMMIVGVIYLMRQFWAKGMRFDMKGRHIRVVDVVSLGVNRSIFLVAVGKKHILLGSSDKGLNYLMEVTGLEGAEMPEGLTGEGGVSFHGELENAASKDMYKTQSFQDRSVSFVDRMKSKLKRLDEDKTTD
ncbi:MAG: flagellar biosynthetic protein FliO [bacterium]